MLRIRHVFSSALLFAFFGATFAHAQSSVYVGVNDSDYGYQLLNTNTFATKKDVVGFTGGYTYLFHSNSRLKAGPDIRFDASPGYDGGEAATASLRVAFVPRKNRFSPYFQIGGGFVSTDARDTPPCPLPAFGGTCPTVVERRNGAALAIGFGFNVRLTDHLYVRPIELFGEAGSKTGHGSFGPALGYRF